MELMNMHCRFDRRLVIDNEDFRPDWLALTVSGPEVSEGIYLDNDQIDRLIETLTKYRATS